jgi:hypothetical protein
MTHGAWVGCAIAIEDAALCVLATLDERSRKTQSRIHRLQESAGGKDPVQLVTAGVALLPHHNELKLVRVF